MTFRVLWGETDHQKVLIVMSEMQMSKYQKQNVIFLVVAWRGATYLLTNEKRQGVVQGDAHSLKFPWYQWKKNRVSISKYQLQQQVTKRVAAWVASRLDDGERFFLKKIEKMTVSQWILVPSKNFKGQSCSSLHGASNEFGFGTVEHSLGDEKHSQRSCGQKISYFHQKMPVTSAVDVGLLQLMCLSHPTLNNASSDIGGFAVGCMLIYSIACKGWSSQWTCLDFLNLGSWFLHLAPCCVWLHPGQVLRYGHGYHSFHHTIYRSWCNVKREVNNPDKLYAVCACAGSELSLLSFSARRPLS